LPSGAAFRLTPARPPQVPRLRAGSVVLLAVRRSGRLEFRAFVPRGCHRFRPPAETRLSTRRWHLLGTRDDDGRGISCTCGAAAALVKLVTCGDGFRGAGA